MRVSCEMQFEGCKEELKNLLYSIWQDGTTSSAAINPTIENHEAVPAPTLTHPKDQREVP